MFEMLEKVVLAGLGAMSLSQKKADELLDELREKYKMSEDEGRDFLGKAENMAKEMKSRLYELAETEVKKAIDKVGLVPRDEFEKLQKRVEELEEKLKNN
jgi:polyhydroxyalkanoate synthesis regulator phasin